MEAPPDTAAQPEGPAQRFLERLAAGDAGTIAAEAVAVVVAHPDDESIALGAQLPRLKGVTLVHVTDGAPRDGIDARSHGFQTPEAYAAARRRELEAAMAVADIPPSALVSLGIPDQEASLRLAETARRLACLFSDRAIRIILTHAFEGGHPDHDATAFAVHAAAGFGRGAPAIVEMPFYSLGPHEGWATQRFLPVPGVAETELRIEGEALHLKRRMLEAHLTQQRVLATFSPEVERFRPAPRYDFTVPPNGGRLLYERYSWGMTGTGWQGLARTALAELGMGAAA